jgi:hypothetical protein
LLGEQEDIMTDTQQDMLEQEKTPKNLDAIKKHLKDGEEPEEILHSLVSSPLIDLKARELAKILIAEDGSRKVVLAIFYDVEWIDGKGLVSVGKTDAE